MLTRNKPDLSTLHEFGTKVWVHDNSRSKLDGCSHIGCWVGYDEESCGHQIIGQTSVQWVLSAVLNLMMIELWFPKLSHLRGSLEETSPMLQIHLSTHQLLYLLLHLSSLTLLLQFHLFLITWAMVLSIPSHPSHQLHWIFLLRATESMSGRNQIACIAFWRARVL